MENSQVTEGSLVLVVYKAKGHERGWDNSWIPGMDKQLCSVFPVEGWYSSAGINCGLCSFPYFSLVKLNKRTL